MEAEDWGQGTFLEVGTRRSLSGVAIVAPSGELDVSNADRFRDTVERLQQQVDHLVIDLRGLVFMGVVGLHILYAAWKAAQARGTRLSVVARDAGEVRHLLEVSGLDQTLELVLEADEIAS
jgi:anti-anti-sigma factor